MPVRDVAVFTVTFTHSFDSIAQAERGGCAKCGPKVCDKVRSPHTHPRTSRVYRYDCLISQFTVIHTCADTHDPEVMAYCSICGCKYDSHPTTARWRQEKEAGERADRARYERVRAAQDAQDAARFEESAMEANNKWETKMYAALGIDSPRNGISRKELDRAYRKCALRWHPDKFHGNASDGEKREATRRFVEAADAYRRLTTSGGI